jgi:hypothetical protein
MILKTLPSQRNSNSKIQPPEGKVRTDFNFQNCMYWDMNKQEIENIITLSKRNNPYV